MAILRASRVRLVSMAVAMAYPITFLDQASSIAARYIKPVMMRM